MPANKKILIRLLILIIPSPLLAQIAIHQAPTKIEVLCREKSAFSHDDNTRLAEEMFKVHHITGDAAGLAHPILLMMIEAQDRFDSGNQPPISEDQVVAGVNQIASKIAAPSYAYTNAAEVRLTRVRMSLVEPHLIGRLSFTHPVTATRFAGNLVSEKMSPLEAFHVSATLLEQKLYNPLYQTTANEQRIATRDGQDSLWSTKLAAERFSEIHGVLVSAGRKYSMMDLFEWAVTSMSTLGITHLGGSR